MDITRTPQAVQRCHELLRWVIPLLDKLPRNRRFTLGGRLEEGMLFVLEHLVQAAYAKDKYAALAAANSRLQAVRHLWRLCYELQNISARRYAHGAELLEDLGRQIGGWRRSGGRP